MQKQNFEFGRIISKYGIVNTCHTLVIQGTGITRWSVDYNSTFSVSRISGYVWFFMNLLGIHGEDNDKNIRTLNTIMPTTIGEI
jgi:hypothetical protein